MWKTTAAASYHKHTVMAEINAPAKTGKRKTQAPRIDLTPMVDLGFLLITFFMFTTTLANPKALQITMPDSVDHPETPTPYIAEATITLIPVSGHKVVYYNGALESKDQLKTESMTGIRSVLLDKKNAVAALPATFSKEAHKLHVLIKPDVSSSYADLVSILDEMTIEDVPYYAIVDITTEEKAMLKK